MIGEQVAKQHSIRSTRTVKEIATIVKRTLDDPKALGIALRTARAMGGSTTRWESVPTDSFDHFAFGVMDSEPDWSVRYIWEATQNPGWWAIDFIVFDQGDHRDVSIDVIGAALVSKMTPNGLAKRVLQQL